MTQPLPGSDEAVAQGCACPTGLNAGLRKLAYDGELVTFWTTKNCKLHGQDK